MWVLILIQFRIEMYPRLLQRKWALATSTVASVFTFELVEASTMYPHLIAITIATGFYSHTI